MEPGDVTDVWFAIDAQKNGWVVFCHPDILRELVEIVGTVNMDDGGFKHYPDKPGFYKAKCTFQVEGYGEDVDIWYNLSEIEEISLAEKGS